MNNVQPLDEVDLTLLALLQADGRMPNNALAERVGIAPSTCHNRVRHLREIGAITGIHADVSPAWIGRPIQAMIAVRIGADARPVIKEFSDAMAQHPAVLNVYFVSGGDDFLLHVAAADTAELRDFVVEELSSKPFVAGTETHLIFEHVRGRPIAAGLASGTRPRRAG